MAEEEVGLRLALKNRREVVDGIDDVGDKLDRAGDEADRLNRRSRIATGGLISLGKSGKLAGRAIAYGVGGAATAVVGAGIILTKFSKDAIGEAREAQKVSAVTRAEIKATGGVANVTEKSMSRLTGAISAKVGIDDEAIQSGANLLLTFKNVRNETGKSDKIFNQATRAAVNLSAAGFGSIESGSKMLGKALNDPLKGITALSRAGVTFSDEQVKRIEGFVKENDLLSAQKIILGEVKSQVGGVAAEQATWGDKAGVLWGNIEERFGTAILPLLDDAERWFVQKGGPQLDRWVGVFEDRGIPALERGVRLIESKALPAIGDFIDDARPLAESIIPAIGSGLGTAADAFKVIAPRAKAVFDAFNDLPDWAKSAIAITAGVGVVGKKAGLFDRESLLGSIASKAKPLPVLVVNQGWDLPGGDKSPLPKAAGKGASILTAVPQVAALAATGYVAYRAEKNMLPGQKRSLATMGMAAGGPSLGTNSGDWASTHSSQVLADRRKGALIDATAKRDWSEVLRLVGLYHDSIRGSVYGVQALDKAGNDFSSKFGVSLEDANRILGGELPKSNQKLRSQIDQTIRKQAELTPVFLGNKAAAQDLLDRVGLIARDWRGSVTIDTSTSEARLASLQSKVNALDVATGLVATGGGGRTPRVTPPRAPKHHSQPDPAQKTHAGAPTPGRPLHVHVNVDGREMTEVVLGHVESKLARE